MKFLSIHIYSTLIIIVIIPFPSGTHKSECESNKFDIHYGLQRSEERGDKKRGNYNS